MKKLLLLFMVLLVSTVGVSCIESEQTEELLDKVADIKDRVEEAIEEDVTPELLDKAADIKDRVEEAMEEDVASEPPVESEDLKDMPVAGEKTVTVWIRDGVRNATMNGGNPLALGQDNSVIIMVDHPLWVEFDYTDSFGRDQHTRIDLDDYYDFFILHENGGWTQLKYRDAYEDEKDAPAS